MLKHNLLVGVVGGVVDPDAAGGGVVERAIGAGDVARLSRVVRDDLHGLGVAVRIGRDFAEVGAVRVVGTSSRRAGGIGAGHQLGQRAAGGRAIVLGAIKLDLRA